ncbi:hypothetical protein PJP10_32740, partial [Mycobacterium kansasii]
MGKMIMDVCTFTHLLQFGEPAYPSFTLKNHHPFTLSDKTKKAYFTFIAIQRKSKDEVDEQ